MDTSGRRFDRMTVARKSLLHVQMGMHAVEIGDEDTVKRRARSRKPRGKRRNTIAGTDQKEIEEVAGNGLVQFLINSHSFFVFGKDKFLNCCQKNSLCQKTFYLICFKYPEMYPKVKH